MTIWHLLTAEGLPDLWVSNLAALALGTIFAVPTAAALWWLMGGRRR